MAKSKASSKKRRVETVFKKVSSKLSVKEVYFGPGPLKEQSLKRSAIILQTDIPRHSALPANFQRECDAAASDNPNVHDDEPGPSDGDGGIPPEDEEEEEGIKEGPSRVSPE